MRYGVRIAPAAMAAALLLGGCEHKELCYEHPHTSEVRVLFDWSGAPEAVPASMTLYLFPTSASTSYRYDFTGREGGLLRAPRGEYLAGALNGDSEVVECRNTEGADRFEITTVSSELLPGLATMGVRASGVPVAPDAADERMAEAPDAVWSARAGAFPIRGPRDTLRMAPQDALSTCTVEIFGVEHLENVAALGASLSGMSGGFLPIAERLSDERVTVPFELARVDATSLQGRFRVFGHCPEQAGKHALIVYAVLTDGSKWYYTYDVTEQIHTSEDPRHIRIRLDGLPLPEPATGGFNPSVDDWQEVRIDIEM